MTIHLLNGAALRYAGLLITFPLSWAGSVMSAAAPAAFSLSGDWEVRVAPPSGTSATVRVVPPAILAVQAEKHDHIPSPFWILDFGFWTPLPGPVAADVSPLTLPGRPASA